MDVIEKVPVVDVEAELDALAARYRGAGRYGIDILNVIGGQAESLLDRLPRPVRARRVRGRLNSAVSAAMGAVGGMGGLPTALAELPVTTTLLLRVIQGVAREHGFDPSEESVRFDAVRVFSSAGPLEADDGADLGFIAARMTLTGPAVRGVIARVSPRLATVLGQKLAAQTVPVLGAVAGAATNYAYTTYYQEIAHVHFGLRRLAIDADMPVEDLVARLRIRVRRPLEA